MYHAKSCWDGTVGKLQSATLSGVFYEQCRGPSRNIRANHPKNSMKMMESTDFSDTPPKFNIAPENWWLEDEISFWDGRFSGAMLVSGRVFSSSNSTKTKGLNTLDLALPAGRHKLCIEKRSPSWLPNRLAKEIPEYV